MSIQTFTYEYSTKNLREIIWLGRKSIEPREHLTVSQWAEKNRFVTREESTRPGMWDNTLVPFGIEIMDSFNDPNIKQITVMASAQVAKTEIMKNAIGYSIDNDPKKTLVVYPTEDDARDFSLQKLQPMLDRNDCLFEKMEHPNNRKENKTLYKKYAGGALWIVGSHSPTTLARRSVQWVIGDDVDRIPAEAGEEGDPWLLAKERTESFSLFEYKHAAFSTPTLKDKSRIENLYLKSDQRKYYVPCPFCGKDQTLEWEQLKWEKQKDLLGEKTLEHYPETAAYECIECHELIDESYKSGMVLKGYWKAEFPERKEHRGYWINRLYSPWSTWEALVKKFLDTKDDEETAKTFWNTSLGRTWEAGDIESVEDKSLLKRNEDYLTHEFPHTPAEVLIVSAAIDVQGDRLELLAMGWGIGKESWVLAHETFSDNPQQDDVWETAFEFALTTVFIREDGVELKIKRLFIDNSAYTNRVNEVLYKLRKKMRSGELPKMDETDRKNYGVWGIKGKAGMDRPLIPRTFTRSFKNRLFTLVLGVDNAKTSIYKRLAIENHGSKYIHFTKSFCDINFFEQLLAERRIPKHTMRGTTYYWEVKKKGKRNEVFDLMVYNFACEEHLNPNYEIIKEKLIAQSEKIKLEREEDGAERKLETGNRKPETVTKKPAVTVRRTSRSRHNVASEWN